MSRKSVENATFVFKRGVFALSRLCQENIVSSKLVENGVEVLSKRGNFVSIRVTSANSLFLKLLAQTMNYMDSLAGPYNRLWFHVCPHVPYHSFQASIKGAQYSNRV